jgi:CO/xanthine dehydrogenase Mo-binding subunit
MSAEPLPGLAATDPMLDAADRVFGRLRYTFDVVLPDMAHAALVRSTIPSGDVVSIDASRARELAGVLAVVTWDDVEAAGLAAARTGGLHGDRPVLADRTVRHAGEPVAAVIAGDEATARRAASLVRTEIRPLAAILSADAAIAPGARHVHPDRDNVVLRTVWERGDLASARERAAVVREGTFWSPSAQTASLEPQVTVARWTGPEVEVWSATQSPSSAASELERAFGLRPDAVHVRVAPLGGGFGGKNKLGLEPLVALLARLVGRPVRLANLREEEFVTVTKHAARTWIESGVDEHGAFLFRNASILWDGGAYALSSPAVSKSGGLSVCGPYRVPTARVESTVVYTNHQPAGSFRGLGVNQVAWAGEQQVDELAAALQMDPVEFRRRNVIRPGDRLFSGERVADAHWLECLESAVGQMTAPAPAEDGRSRGRGVALSMKQTITPSRSEASVTARRDGTFEVACSSVDMGQGARTVLTRIAARALEVPISRVALLDPDAPSTHYDETTSSSRTTHAMGIAIQRAVASLVDRLIEHAPRAIEIEPSEVTYASGGLGREGGRLDVGELLERIGLDRLEGHGSFVNEPEPDDEAGSVSSSHWHQGAAAVEVAVDDKTGEVEVVQARGAAWAGEVISAAGARLQNEGNLVFGIGAALTEELRFEDGLPRPTDLRNYRIPSILDVPQALGSAALAADGPADVVHGLGENIMPAVAPAIANALTSAVGARVRTLPLTPERVLRAIEAERTEADA